MSGILASLPSPSARLKMKANSCCSPSTSVFHCVCSRSPFYSSDSEFKSISLRAGFPKLSLQCCSSSRKSGASGPGDNDNQTLLDAFFLGKAVAEVINQRIESTVGGFLSAIGNLQAEQQKQVQGFQEEVLNRAKHAKEKAAGEVMEAQGHFTNSTTMVTSVSSTDASMFTSSSSSDSTSTTTPENPLD